MTSGESHHKPKLLVSQSGLAKMQSVHWCSLGFRSEDRAGWQIASMMNLPIWMFSGKCQPGYMFLGCEHRMYLWTSRPTPVESLSDNSGRIMHKNVLLEITLKSSGILSPVFPCTQEQSAILLQGCYPSVPCTSPGELACLIVSSLFFLTLHRNTQRKF